MKYIVGGIKDIQKSEIDKVSQMASDVFSDDHYYKSVYKGGNIKEWLYNLFFDCIHKCFDCGIVKGVYDNNKLISFILLFDFNHVKENNKDFFNEVFPNDLNELSDKMYEITKGSRYLYLLLIGTLKEYQGKGISKMLIENIINEYKDYKIISDVSSPILEYILNKYFMFNVDFEYNGLKIMSN